MRNGIICNIAMSEEELDKVEVGYTDAYPMG